jgi:Icc protein
MARVAWLTDIHLNFVDQDAQKHLYRSVLACRPDAVLLSGDIAEGPEVCRYLREMEAALDCPIYFVLGNHDFYRSSIGLVLRQVGALAAGSARLVHLSQSRHIRLTAGTAVVGHEGWGDARLGNYARSEVTLSDFFAIAELAEVQWDRRLLIERLRALGDQAAAHLERVLPEALETCLRVIVVTHVPPFREAAWHEGATSDNDWLPFFACRAVGEVLRETMQSRPDRQMLVLCGHTHGGGEVQILDNLRVRTGPAAYGRPQVCQELEID